jgi:hypothetical protein
MPPGTEAFWAELHEKTTRAVEEMIGKSGKELGYSRSQYTAGDFKCMSWFVAWAIAEGTRRSNPRLCPESFTKWLEKNQTRACSDSALEWASAPLPQRLPVLEGCSSILASSTPARLSAHSPAGRNPRRSR